MTNSSFLIYSSLYLLLPVAYLMGSVPFGVIISKRRGIDLRTTGSKNIGATNVLRTTGKFPALLTLIGDSMKGAVPVLICGFIITNIEQSAQLKSIYTERELWEGIVGLMAILGHIYPVFLSFKGGKGVATTFGVLVVYSPLSALVIFFIWVLIAVFSRYSSLAAVGASVSLPVVFLLSDASIFKISFGILIAFLIVLKHGTNIKRLIEGEEPKIGGKAES